MPTKEFKTPLSHVTAEIGFLEFYNTKNKLAAGTYEVIEADGSKSYCAVTGDGGIFQNETWYSEEDYEKFQQDYRDDRMFEANMSWNPEDLAESDVNAFNEAVRNHELSREINYHDDDRIL